MGAILDTEYVLTSRLLHAAIKAPRERQLLFVGTDRSEAIMIPGVSDIEAAYRTAETLALAAEHRDFAFCIDFEPPKEARRDLLAIVVASEASFVALAYVQDLGFGVQISQRYPRRLLLPDRPYPPARVKAARAIVGDAATKTEEWVN